MCFCAPTVKCPTALGLFSGELDGVFRIASCLRCNNCGVGVVEKDNRKTFVKNAECRVALIIEFIIIFTYISIFLCNETQIIPTKQYNKVYLPSGSSYNFIVHNEEDTNRILISFDTEYGKLVVNDIESFLSEHWTITHNNHSLLIYDYELVDKSLKNAKLYGTIQLSLELNKEQYAKIRFLPQYKNKEIVRRLTNDVREQCNINLENNTCYYIIDISEYDKQFDITLYTEGVAISLCALWFDEKQFDINNYQTDLSELLHEYQCDFKGDNIIHLNVTPT